MKTNIGLIDKITRVVIGTVAIGWGTYSQNWLGGLGLIPIAAAVASWCPLYTLLGVKTCQLKD